MEEVDQPLEELLVLRVVSAAHRRRVRRAVVAGLLVVLASSGAAIELTHRSGAQPTARAVPPTVLTPTSAASTTPTAGATGDDATRAAILAVARAKYESGRESSRGSRTHIEFGRLTVSGDHATLQVNFVCVPMCGHGEELSLAKRAGTWQVVGVRQTWVS